MKKLFTSLFSLMLMGAFLSLNAQQIPNAGFENWTGGKPVSWDAPNINIAFPPIVVTTVTEETTAPYAGAKSCRIETKANPMGGNLPGFITLGQFDLMTQTISGGHPFTHRPTKLKGYYKYQPEAGDQAFIGVGLSKWMGTTRDTIGTGLLMLTAPQASWTLFEVDIDWTSADNPDSLNIIISSSDLLGGSYILGSTLWVDELTFEYGPVNIPSIEKTVFAINNYPNPFSENTTIEFVAPKNGVYEFHVFNMIGMEVFNTEIKASEGLNTFVFSSENLNSGLYMYRLSDGAIVETKSMMIVK